MPTYPGPHGTELSGHVDEIVADYADGSGRYVQYLITEQDATSPTHLLTRLGEDDLFAVELQRAEHLDGVLTGTEWMITDRFGSSMDHGIEEGADGLIQVDGLAYVMRWADDVVVTGADLPTA